MDPAVEMGRQQPPLRNFGFTAYRHYFSVQFNQFCAVQDEKLHSAKIKVEGASVKLQGKFTLVFSLSSFLCSVAA